MDPKSALSGSPRSKDLRPKVKGSRRCRGERPAVPGNLSVMRATSLLGVFKRHSATERWPWTFKLFIKGGGMNEAGLAASHLVKDS